MRKIAVVLLIVFLASTALSASLSACAAHAAAPTPTETLTPTVTAIPTETPLPPTETPNPYTKIDYFDRSTWTVEMNEIYSSLANRLLAEPGSALEAKYTKENLTFHNGLSFGMINYLESKGITTYSNLTEADFQNPEKINQLYVAFRNAVNSDPAADKLSQVDPWMIERNLNDVNNSVIAHRNTDETISGGFGAAPIYTEAELIASAKKLYPDLTINSFDDVQKIYRDNCKKNPIQIDLFGKKTSHLTL
jgi:hypothetical protein